MSRSFSLILGIITVAGLFPLTLTPGQAAILYVNKDNACPGLGTSGNPYCSIQNAFNAVAAGDIIRIRNSATPYDQRAVATRSGTAARPIILEPDSGHNPIIRYSGNGAQAGAIEIRDADYWTVQNLTFDGAGVRTSQFALWLQAATRNITGNKIIGCTFRNWGGAGEDSHAVALIIHKEYERNALRAIGSLIQGCTFDNNRLYSIETISVQDTIIENNEIKNQRCGRGSDGSVNAVGIHMIADFPGRGADSSGNIIRNNTIHDFQPHSACTLPNQEHATWAGFWCDVNVVSSQLLGNRIYNIDPGKNDYSNPRGSSQTSAGIFIEDRCNGWLVKENIVYRIGAIGLRNGTAVTEGHRNQYLNNVVYKTGLIGIHVARGSGIVIKNNIFFDNGEAQIEFLSIAIGQGSHTIRYNLYFDLAGGNKVGKWDSWNVLNFASWRSQSGDSNSSNTNPLFVNASGGDFHLRTSSPARGAGENGVDMGAYPLRESPLLSPPTNVTVR